MNAYLWETPCAVCGVSVLFPFPPQQPKLCDACYQRPHKPVGHAAGQKDRNPSLDDDVPHVPDGSADLPTGETDG